MLTPGTARPTPSTPASSRTAVDGGSRRSITATRPRPAMAARLTNTSRRSDQTPQTRAGHATGGCGSASLELSTAEVGAGRETSIHSASAPSSTALPGPAIATVRRRKPTTARTRSGPSDGDEAERPLDIVVGERLCLEGRDFRRHVLDATHEVEQGAVAEIRGWFGEVVVEGPGLGDGLPEIRAAGSGDQVSLAASDSTPACHPALSR